ncbi:hypothetical protein V6Z11_D09G030800 [Gossypium hirsutum]
MGFLVSIVLDFNFRLGFVRFWLKLAPGKRFCVEFALRNKSV